MIKHKETSILAQRAQEQEEQRKARLQGEAVRLARRSAAKETGFTDEEALELPDLFPTWEEALAAGAQLTAGTCLTKDGQVYRVMQAVTPQAHQPPDSEGMLAVYRPVSPGHAGTADDPIPWEYGMDCLAGQYFSYEGHIYRVAAGGDMIPCVWTPGTAGLWQWELIE